MTSSRLPIAVRVPGKEFFSFTRFFPPTHPSPPLFLSHNHRLSLSPPPPPPPPPPPLPPPLITHHNPFPSSSPSFLSLSLSLSLTLSHFSFASATAALRHLHLITASTTKSLPSFIHFFFFLLSRNRVSTASEQLRKRSNNSFHPARQRPAAYHLSVTSHLLASYITQARVLQSNSRVVTCPLALCSRLAKSGLRPFFPGLDSPIWLAFSYLPVHTYFVKHPTSA